MYLTEHQKVLFWLFYDILLYLSLILSSLSIYAFFDIEFICLKILLFKVLINLPATNAFLALCIECNSVLLIMQPRFQRSDEKLAVLTYT